MILMDDEGELEITLQKVEPPTSMRPGGSERSFVSRRWTSGAPMSTSGSLPMTSNASSKLFGSSSEIGVERLNLAACVPTTLDLASEFEIELAM